jgi:alkaline phosphatase
VVTTTDVIDATPAAFVANAPHRYWRETIVSQYPDAGLEVILGGGRQYFDGTARNVTRDRLSGMCERAACVSTAAELAAYRPDDRPLVGLFAPSDLEQAGARSPTLPQMVEAALARLSRNPQGFMAVFETEETDNAGHGNRSFASVAAEMLEFDRALAQVLDFAERNGRTLVIVTSDHETGGLSLPESGDTMLIAYTTPGHTGAMVPLFAFGPGAERFGGMHDNTEIGRMLREVLQR